MAANIIHEDISGDRVYRIGGYLHLSNGETHYYETKITDPVWTQHNEDVLVNMYLQGVQQYDNSGNEIPLGYTVTSVTKTAT